MFINSANEEIRKMNLVVIMQQIAELKWAMEWV